MIHETMFTFDMFEAVRCYPCFRGCLTSPVHQKFAHSDITQTLLACVARYKEFTSADQMKRVVSLMHRQVVKAKAEGLYFNVRLTVTAEVYYLTCCVGIHTRPLPDDPRGREVAPEGPALQGSHQSHQLHPPAVLQSG